MCTQIIIRYFLELSKKNQYVKYYSCGSKYNIYILSYIYILCYRSCIQQIPNGGEICAYSEPFILIPIVLQIKYIISTK